MEGPRFMGLRVLFESESAFRHRWKLLLAYRGYAQTAETKLSYPFSLDLTVWCLTFLTAIADCSAS